MNRPTMLVLDHLVYAVRDLDDGIDRIAERLGVRAAPGGRHPAWGTRNAVLSLGPRTYLEIVAPDPEATPRREPRPLGVEDPRAPYLATWAAATDDIERTAALASSAGLDLGPVQPGSRRRTDGVLLRWRLTDPNRPREDGVVPFLIEWGSTPHPATAAPGGCSIVACRGEHPEADRIGAALRRSGIDLPLRSAPRAALVATIQGPTGAVELR